MVDVIGITSDQLGKTRIEYWSETMPPKFKLSPAIPVGHAV